MKHAADFLKECKGSICVVHHGDADGCTAAAIIGITIKKLYNKIPEIFSPLHGGSRLTEDLVEGILKFDNIIIVDLGEKNESLVKKIEHKHAMWLDHHMDAQPLQTKLLYINPHYWLEENLVPPASYLSYQIANLLFDATPLCWLAAIGVIGDKEEKLCSDVIDLTFKMYPHLEGGSMGQFEILRYMVGWVSSGRSFSGGAGAIIATKALIEAGLAKNPVLLFEGTPHADELLEYESSTRKRIKEIFENSKIEVKGNVVICEIDVKSYIQNYLAGILRGKYPRHLIVVANFGLHDGIVQIELRRTSDFDINLREIARKSVEELEASAGGHPEAAGVRIPKSDWPKFKDRIFALLKPQ